MVATGITPEAIETVRFFQLLCEYFCPFTLPPYFLVTFLQNPIIYDLMNEMGWRTVSPDVNGWMQQYVQRRYGGYSSYASQAWELLLQATYLQARVLFFTFLNDVNFRAMAAFFVALRAGVIESGLTFSPRAELR